MDDAFEVGEHSAVFEGPDLCFITWGEHVTTEDIRSVHDELKRRTDETARLFVLSDSTRMTDIESSARQALTSMIDLKNLRGAATFGMNFQTRVAAILIIKILEIAGTLPLCPVRIFATGEEARAWIEELRGRA